MEVYRIQRQCDVCWCADARILIRGCTFVRGDEFRNSPWSSRRGTNYDIYFIKSNMPSGVWRSQAGE